MHINSFALLYLHFTEIDNILFENYFLDTRRSNCETK